MKYGFLMRHIFCIKLFGYILGILNCNVTVIMLLYENEINDHNLICLNMYLKRSYATAFMLKRYSISLLNNLLKFQFSILNSNFNFHISLLKISTININWEAKVQRCRYRWVPFLVIFVVITLYGVHNKL